MNASDSIKLCEQFINSPGEIIKLPEIIVNNEVIEYTYQENNPGFPIGKGKISVNIILTSYGSIYIVAIDKYESSCSWKNNSKKIILIEQYTSSSKKLFNSTDDFQLNCLYQGKTELPKQVQTFLIGFLSENPLLLEMRKHFILETYNNGTKCSIANITKYFNLIASVLSLVDKSSVNPINHLTTHQEHNSKLKSKLEEFETKLEEENKLFDKFALEIKNLYEELFARVTELEMKKIKLSKDNIYLNLQTINYHFSSDFKTISQHKQQNHLASDIIKLSLQNEQNNHSTDQIQEQTAQIETLEKEIDLVKENTARTNELNNKIYSNSLEKKIKLAKMKEELDNLSQDLIAQKREEQKLKLKSTLENSKYTQERKTFEEKVKQTLGIKFQDIIF
jgi:hypothetical protein